MPLPPSLQQPEYEFTTEMLLRSTNSVNGNAGSGSSRTSNSLALRIFEIRSANDSSPISNDVAAEPAIRCPLEVCRIDASSKTQGLAGEPKHNGLSMVLQRDGSRLCNITRRPVFPFAPRQRLHECKDATIRHIRSAAAR
jgi:hypothetical protein